MSLLDRVFPKDSSQQSAPAGMVPADKIAKVARKQQAAGGAKAPGNSELLAKRDRLIEKIALIQADLGGLTYEMAIRDHYRLDVLTRKAAELQRVDVELGQIERLIKMDDSGASGTCSSCGTLHARGAVFCSQCGHSLEAAGAAPSNGASNGASNGNIDLGTL